MSLFPNRLWFFCALAGLAAVVGLTNLASAVDPPPTTNVHWNRKILDTKFRSEGVAAGDFNRDGKMDIAAGNVWFEAPNWEMRLFRDKAEEFNPHNYSNSFVNVVEDRNGDGWDDLIVVDFPGIQTWWFENPQNKPGPWKKHVVVDVTNNESPQYLDVDGDGKKELLFATSNDPKQPNAAERFMALARPQQDPTKPFVIQRISANSAPSTEKFSHGLGAGDINGDGRNDVVVPKGWWEGPAAGAEQAEWKFHEAPFGENCSQMYVYDFNGDGRNDVLSTSAHLFGMWWHEQTENGWKTHEISKLFSQTHALCLADINGDGKPDFVTGKRYWAHGPAGDIDPHAPAIVAWYELRQKDGKPFWIPREIDHNSGVGTQFEVVDINGDGLLDVITSNKRGVFLFEQLRDKPAEKAAAK
ncbi:MAG: FG-GAP-like repeat-containing protein [Planctomycetota bacterium]|nr:FG-GAP-like repeat-containing protein [Planctomycetota bacterium]